ncbi:MAG: ABC transporter permease [Cellvibrionales bacterium]|nr:ABC transporter permease [Cellvibrionales bacterium]
MMTLAKRQQPSHFWVYLSPLLAIALTLATGSLLFALLDVDPLHALTTFFITPLSDTFGVGELLIKSTPILLCALGLSLCYRAGIWNIGAEGQLIAGSISTTLIALAFIDSNTGFSLPLALLAGMLGGAVFAGIAALLKYQFNTNEILTTIMLNYIAYHLLQWGVHGPLRDPNGFNFPESALFDANTILPILLDGTRAHLGVLFTPIVLVLTWVLLSKSFAGFQIETLGLSPLSARMAGFSSKKIGYSVFLLSGALAGLAGAIEVTGPIGQLVPQVSPGYGFAAIIVAFLGRLHPVGIMLAGLLMGLIHLGGELVQLELGLPKSITGIFQGLLLFYLLSCDVFIQYRLTTQPGGLLHPKKTQKVT